MSVNKGFLILNLAFPPVKSKRQNCYSEVAEIEDTTRNAQPLDRAWTTPKPRVANVVPAPRLELGTP
jgi:hypothetical protein